MCCTRLSCHQGDGAGGARARAHTSLSVMVRECTLEWSSDTPDCLARATSSCLQAGSVPPPLLSHRAFHVLHWAVTRVTVLGVCVCEHTQCEMRCEQAVRWVG